VSRALCRRRVAGRRLTEVLLCTGVLVVAVAPILLGTLTSRPLHAQRQAQAACHLLALGVTHPEATLRQRAVVAASAAALRDSRWNELSRAVGLDAAQATAVHSSGSCAAADAQITWSPPLHMGICLLTLGLLILPSSFGARRILPVLAPTLLYGAGVVLIASAI